MKAAVRDRFGPPEVVEIRELEMPAPDDDDVLVRVQAASLNLADWYGVMGRPWLGRAEMGIRRPRTNRIGTDYAGVVEAVGRNVTEFAPGDEVFGGRTGAFAEHICARADRGIVKKPAGVTFEEAAAVPVAALTALQALRNKGGLEKGQKVLVNGSSGGVGTYAVQIARALGGAVTAVCSPPNVVTSRELGAERVVDYTREDFTRLDERFDLMLDVAGSKSWSQCKRVLSPEATLVIVGSALRGNGRLLGPLSHVLATKLASIPGKRKAVFFIAKFNKPDMETLRELLASGRMRSVIDRRYALDEIGDALRYIGDGHARGKIVLTMP
jgi:NADPH:quinone reductase-like Zn-dependent oxidoreductase